MTPEDKSDPDLDSVPEPAAFLEIQLDEGPRPVVPKAAAVGETETEIRKTPDSDLSSGGSIVTVKNCVPELIELEESPRSKSSVLEESASSQEDVSSVKAVDLDYNDRYEQISDCSIISVSPDSRRHIYSKEIEAAIKGILSPPSLVHAQVNAVKAARPSIICYASNSSTSTASERASTASASTPSSSKSKSRAKRGDAPFGKSKGSSKLSISSINSGRIGAQKQCPQFSKYAKYITGVKPSAATCARNLFGRACDEGETRLIMNRTGFIDLTSLLPTPAPGTSANSVHRIQVGQKQTKNSKQADLPSRFTEQSSPLPPVNESEYVTVKVYHTDPRVDRLIRCYACQTVLKFMKLQQRGRRHFAKNLNPETFYCNYCLKRKFATRDHYEYCI